MSENLEIFPWNENFETKIPIIDEQHKKLVILLNKLVSQIANPSSQEILEDAFRELQDYTVYHFQTEEEIWNETFQDDPWASGHKQSHNDFISKILAIKEQKNIVPFDKVLDEIITVLTHWLALHIIDTDKRMAFAVLAYRETSSIEEAKHIADQKMTGATKAMVDTIMSMYDQLASRTMLLSREIHKRKEAEEKLKVLMFDLEKARKQAEEATQAKSDFLAIMSHEIRTPLNAIVGMTHLVLQTDLNDRQKKYIQTIKISGAHIMGILNDILDFSKIEAGKMNLEEIEFELEGIINLTEIFLKEKIGTKKILLFIEVSSDIPRELIGDPLRISQILLNLGYNAVKFTEKGSITVRILLISQTKDTVTLQFDIEDTGIGLKKEQMEKLFLSFQQADMSTTRKYGGTGLGLSISKHLVELMNGKIGVESEFQKGSKFWFQLEIKKVKDGFNYQSNRKDNYGLSDAREIELEEDVRKMSGSLVLLVEDNALNQEVAQELLRTVGLDVEIAENGEVAIQMLSQKEYDIILMDMQMPIMDGITATQEIRKNPKWEKYPIIAMTANATLEDKKACLDAGMNDFLPKPMIPRTLWLKLVQWLPSKNLENITELKDSTPVEQDFVIPSIDTKLGLNLVGGKKDFYISLLGKFANTRKNSSKEIREALKKRDFASAEIIAHTIKGVAGNLGAVELQSKSYLLEKALKTRQDSGEIEKLITEFETTLGFTVSSIEEFLPKEIKSSQIITFDEQKSQNIFSEIKKYLEDDNATALDVWEKNKNIFSSVLAASYARLDSYIRDFRFEDALSLLNQITEKRKEND